MTLRKVRLLPNVKEGWPEQFGYYLGVDGSAYMVEVFTQYREGPRDDGLRNVTLDQIEFLTDGHP